jgi:hypothetical protein
MFVEESESDKEINVSGNLVLAALFPVVTKSVTREFADQARID